MSYCRGCGHQIHETAESCPQCGAVTTPGDNVLRRIGGGAEQEGTLWLPVPSLVCGVVVALAQFDPGEWDVDQVVGCIGFSVAAMVLGGISLAKQKRGAGMAIAGLILGRIGLLGTLGSQW